MSKLSYNGRIGRLKYFIRSLVISIVFYVLIPLVLGALSFFSSSDSGSALVAILIPVCYIVAVVLLSFVIVKRLHDLGKPGSHFFLLLIPLYNIYLSLVLLFQKGTTGPNAYGADPLTQTTQSNASTV